MNQNFSIKSWDLSPNLSSTPDETSTPFALVTFSASRTFLYVNPPEIMYLILKN